MEPAITVCLRTGAGGAQKKKNKNKLQPGPTTVVGGVPAAVTAGDALRAEPSAAAAASLLPAGNASGFPGSHPHLTIVIYSYYGLGGTVAFANLKAKHTKAES